MFNADLPSNLAFRRVPFIVVAAFVTLLSSISVGEPVYKSVAPGGTVSYGDKPITGSALVREIPIEAAPSYDQVERARSVTQRIRQSADAMEEARLARESVLDRARKDREMEQQFQAELEAEIKQVELTAEAQRLARQKQLDAQKPKRPKPKPKGPPTTADKAINMRPNAPLLNLPGPAE